MADEGKRIAREDAISTSGIARKLVTKERVTALGASYKGTYSAK